MQVDVACPADISDRLVEAIAGAANTGTIGDGKIFVRSLDTIVRIRTGERDAQAVST